MKNKDIQLWAKLYSDAFVNESATAIEEGANDTMVDNAYITAAKKYLKPLHKINKRAYDLAVTYLINKTGTRLAVTPEQFADARIQRAQTSTDTTDNLPKDPRERSFAIAKDMAAKKQAEFDKLQKDEFDRKHPNNIKSIWVKSMKINSAHEDKSEAQLLITYRNGKTEDIPWSIQTTGIAGDIENTDKQYKMVRRNLKQSGKPYTDFDVRLALIRVQFSEPSIKWFYGPLKASDQSWAFTKEAAKIAASMKK